MVQVIVSKEQLEEILGLGEPFDLCDETGRRRARVSVIPSEVSYADIVVPYSREELEAARLEPTVSTEHVRQRLRSLEARP